VTILRIIRVKVNIQMLSRMESPMNLKVHGQGVFIFNTAGPCVINFLNINGARVLAAEFTTTSVVAVTTMRLIDPDNTLGLSTLPGAYYWFSVDAQNQLLYAGVGEARLETAIYKFKLPADQKALLESIVMVDAHVTPIKLLKDPVTSKVALRIREMDEITMEHIAKGVYMPLANLSATSQKLYRCIAGKQFQLNDRDFPDFAKAIQRSIVTPGLWCHEKLKDKANEFSKDKPNLAETYLRITLGQNNGESPGIPYVMEIWPAGHYSPIHSHAAADAIIRVLHGSIHVKLFPFLCASTDGVEPFSSAHFKKDERTWISPTLNQVHQLKNVTNDVCVTIQCYMYEDKDKAHYDYFDYLDENGEEQQYEPDSDMGFVEFKDLIRKEWAQRPRWSCFS
jgi:hypothetical protein